MKYTKEQHQKALRLFTPHKKYKLEEYYGVSLIKLQKNNKFSIKLMYGWSESGKNSEMSQGAIIEKFEDAINLYTILENFSQDGETKSANLDFLYNSEPSTVEDTVDGLEKIDYNIISKDDELEQVQHTGENAFD